MVHKVTIIVAKTKVHLEFFDIGGRSPLLNCLSFLRIGVIAQLDTMWPKFSNSVRPNSHLVGFLKRKIDMSLDKTHSMYWRSLDVEDTYTRISSKYSVQRWSKDA